MLIIIIVNNINITFDNYCQRIVSITSRVTVINRNLI